MGYSTGTKEGVIMWWSRELLLKRQSLHSLEKKKIGPVQAGKKLNGI